MTDADTQFEADEFLRLLTDALRAGPSSAAWQEAVSRLRAGGAAAGTSEAEEYRLLTAVREDLESGREYRSVRAGAGFTRKVLESIEQEASGGGRSGGGRLSAGMLALLGGLGAAAVAVVVVALILWSGGGGPPAPELSSLVFSQTLVSSDFATAATVPADWRTFGLAPEVSERGRVLRGSVQKEGNAGAGAAGGGGGGNGGEYRGGGIVLARGIPPTESFAVEARVNLRGPTASADVAVQVFVTDDPRFDTNAQASTPHELVVYLRGGDWLVADASGALQDRNVRARPDGNTIVVKLDATRAIVEVNGQPLFDSPHRLAGERARYPGVRFLTRGSERAAADVGVSAVRILRP